MRKTPRISSGITLVEFIAAVALGLPIVVSMLYAILEANYYFTIKDNLDVAARNAARALANNYAQTGSTNDTVTPTIRIPHFVDPYAHQFTPAPSFEVKTHPYTVTVACIYPSQGCAGATPAMMPFPFPDPLKLGASFQVQTVVTFPIPGD